MRTKIEQGLIVVALLLGACWLWWPKAEATQQPAAVVRSELNIAGLQAAELLETLIHEQINKGFRDTDSTALWAPDTDPGAPGVEPLWKGTVAELKIMLANNLPETRFLLPQDQGDIPIVEY